MASTAHHSQSKIRCGSERCLGSFPTCTSIKETDDSYINLWFILSDHTSTVSALTKMIINKNSESNMAFMR